MANLFLTPETTLSRKVGEEVIVIQLESGLVFHFNPAISQVLEFFKGGASLEDFYATHGIEGDSKEIEYLGTLFQLIVNEKLLVASESLQNSQEKRSAKVAYERPVFVRRGEHTLEQIALLQGC